MSDDFHGGDSHTPVYNIKAVARLVGLLPVTLRAWERRYGLPVPKRGGQGYRLYSEYDVRTLRWLKSQIDAGLSIGRATDLLTDLRSKGLDPANDANRAVEQVASPAVLQGQLNKDLIHFDDMSASDTLKRAFSLYGLDQVMSDVIQPTLVSVEDGWHRGDLPIATEHFSTQFFIQHLSNLLAGASPANATGVIVAACAPGEMEQLGLLMLVTALRWHGWDVKYLGPDLPLDQLAEALSPIHPRMLLFSATCLESAQHLSELPRTARQFMPPEPKVVLIGPAFSEMDPRDLPGLYLQGTIAEMVLKIEGLMES